MAAVAHVLYSKQQRSASGPAGPSQHGETMDQRLKPTSEAHLDMNAVPEVQIMTAFAQAVDNTVGAVILRPSLENANSAIYRPCRRH